MRTTVKLSLAALTATALLASLVASASARNLEISNSQIRAVWTPLIFSDAFNFIRVECNVTMEGSFHARTIVKSAGALIGYITSVGVSHPCTNGEGWAWNGSEGSLTGASTLPWHISYEGFTGTLPNITAIRILLRNTKFTIRNGICLGTYAPANVKGTAAIGADRTMTIRPDGENFSPVEGECPSGRFTGTSGRVTLLGTTTAVTVRLI